MAAQAPQPSLREDKYVALVSGLGLGDDAGDPLKLSLLVDYLVGSLASNEEQTRVSKVPHNRAGLLLSRACPSCNNTCDTYPLLVMHAYWHIHKIDLQPLPKVLCCCYQLMSTPSCLPAQHINADRLPVQIKSPHLVKFCADSARGGCWGVAEEHGGALARHHT